MKTKDFIYVIVIAVVVIIGCVIIGDALRDLGDSIGRGIEMGLRNMPK